MSILHQFEIQSNTVCRNYMTSFTDG